MVEEVVVRTAPTRRTAGRARDPLDLLVERGDLLGHFGELHLRLHELGACGGRLVLRRGHLPFELRLAIAELDAVFGGGVVGRVRQCRELGADVLEEGTNGLVLAARRVARRDGVVDVDLRGLLGVDQARALGVELGGVIGAEGVELGGGGGFGRGAGTRERNAREGEEEQQEGHGKLPRVVAPGDAGERIMKRKPRQYL